MSEAPILRIAIVGAGIAGLTTAIALRKLPAVDVQIYERATELRELGQAIALGPNGLRTLEKLGVEKVFEQDLGSRCPSGFPQTYRHWKTNEILSHDRHSDNVEPRHHMTRFYRPHLQDVLLGYLPRDIIHLKKTVIDVSTDSEQGGVYVSFADGTNTHIDLLVGADGINSSVRRIFAPDFETKWSGMVAYRSAFDMKLLEGIENVPEDSTQFRSPRDMLLTTKLGKNMFGLVALHQLNPSSNPNLPKRTKWDDLGDVTVVQNLYKDYNPLAASILQRLPDVRVYPNFYGGFLDSYCFEKSVVLVGDAAHSHGGALAANASLGIDDAYCLYLSLLHTMFSDNDVQELGPGIIINEPVPGVSSKDSDIETGKQANLSTNSDTQIQAIRQRNISNALDLYNKTRLPHCSKVLRYVHAMYDSINTQLWGNNNNINNINNTANDKKNTQTSDDDDDDDEDQKFRERMKKGGPDVSWVYEHDVNAAFHDVLSENK